MRRIAVLGHVGTENLGDEAVIGAVLHQIRERYPDAEIIAFTGHPEDARQRHGVPSFPIWRDSPAHAGSDSTGPGTEARFETRVRNAIKRAPGVRALAKGIRNVVRLPWVVFRELKFLAKARERLRGVDLFIVAGSNQLNDYWGGAWEFPYTLLKWCVLARSVGARVAFLCCGAGPLQSRLGRRFIRWSLALADSRSYRDIGSQRLVASIGGHGDDPVCSDLAWGLKRELPAPSATPSRLVVGINPLPFFDPRYWPENDSERYQSYIRKLAEFAAWLAARGHRVLFFPTQLRADPPVIADIKAIVADRSVEEPIRSVDDLIQRISMMDVVVATRYHGVVLAAALQRPVLAIAYYRKTSDVMAQLGQSDYVVDINSFTARALETRFAAMEPRLDSIRREIAERSQDMRQALARECDRVLGFERETRRVGARGERAPALAS